jgi:hypothetical protein
LAFPAYVLSSDIQNNARVNLNAYSQIYADTYTDRTSNSNIFGSLSVQLTTFYSYNETDTNNQLNNLSTVQIYDFCISKDKTEIIINAAAKYDEETFIWPFVSFPNISYNALLERSCLLLEKNKTDTGLFEDQYLKNNTRFKDYKFGTFYNNDQVLGEIFWKLDDTYNNINLWWFEYNKYSQKETHIIGQGSIKLNSNVLCDTDSKYPIVFDSYIGNAGILKFTIAYITNSSINPDTTTIATTYTNTPINLNNTLSLLNV